MIEQKAVWESAFLARRMSHERTGGRYLLMTADRKDALEAEYARHGRDHLLRL
jgi:hypothetical protein